MKLKNLSKIIFILLLFLTFKFPLQAQNHKYFIIKGKIISDSSNVYEGNVQIIKNDKPAIVTSIQKNGRFRFELDYNSDYHITFVEQGFISKTINVNTLIPKDEEQLETNYPDFILTVKLYRDNQNAENLYIRNIVQEIKYSPKENNFVRVPTIFDQHYVEKLNSGVGSSMHFVQGKAD